MRVRKLLTSLALGVPLAAAGGGVGAQSSSDAAYMEKVATAAPAQIVRDAAIVQMENGKMRTLKEGTNGFTCMLLGVTPMCADAVAMEWGHALQTHTPPPAKIGFMYMLAGDNGTSNTDPYATKPQPGNHWVETGPHVMIVGGAVKQMTGYPDSADPNVKEPYVMWPGSPYAHLMLPVK